MNLKLLIDGIVRQTTVLIAQLSTASGLRAPLAHVADQVFLDLAREIEAQGVRRQVAADMFGLALRSYQKKMRRLSESESARDQTLWEAVLQFIEREQPRRSQVLTHFVDDGEREVAAVLQDLLRSGLVCTTGGGSGAVFALTSPDLRARLLQQEDVESLAAMIWLKVFRGEAKDRQALCDSLPVSDGLIDAALEQLRRDGRLLESAGQLESTNVLLGLHDEQGWEAAILDHFQSVAVAIASKVARGRQGDGNIPTGGSTFRFTVQPGHPCEREVYDLLPVHRDRIQGLWERVSAHNEAHPPDPDRSVQVTFYLGQSTHAPAGHDPESTATGESEP